MSDIDHPFRAALQTLLNAAGGMSKYRKNPVLYAKEVLNIDLYPEQQEVLMALVTGKQRVICRSSNAFGKTVVAAVFAKWFYDMFPVGECIITGPREESLKDATFKEIRTLHGNKPGLAPKGMRLSSGETHYVKGTVAKDGTNFQSAHSINCAIIFEEAVGIPDEIWTAARGILSSGNTYWLCIFNPTTTACQAYLEEQSGDWDVFSFSAFDHPNIKNQLVGKPITIAAGPTLSSLRLNMGAMGEWIKEDDMTPNDVRFEEPGEEVKFWRPGPDGDARIMGRYPTQSSYSIFGQTDFEVATSFDDEANIYFNDVFAKVADTSYHKIGQPDRFGRDQVPQFGCDVARYGDDRTVIHGRIGRYSFYHESYNGQNTEWTTNRLKWLCIHWGDKFGITPSKIPIKVDDTGISGAVVDGLKKDHNVVPVNFCQNPIEDLHYPNARSEMLFNAALMMRSGDIRFPKKYMQKHQVQELQRQAMSIEYACDGRGRREAEPKEWTKERVRRSPDDLDAMVLAYYGLGSSFTQHHTIAVTKKPILRDNNRNLFGR